MTRELIVIGHNHWDPTWRRAFLRPIAYQGTTVRPYLEMDADVIDRWRALADRGYTFVEGQTAIWREYLRRNPDAEADLKRLVAEGKLEFVRCGETVQDSQMPAAEGLVRNFLVAQPLYEDLVGEDHPGLAIGWCEDAFGNSPNYPQVLAGVGCTCAARLSYRTPDEPVWVGIDGTKLPVLDEVPARFLGHFIKFPPCPACRGAGCAMCEERGVIFPAAGTDPAAIEAQLEAVVAAVLEDGDAEVTVDGAEVAAGMDTAKRETPVYVTVGGEETLPVAELPGMLERFNERYAGRCHLRFGTLAEVHALARPQLDAAVAARDSSPSKDLCPGMPGCMVTRTGTKQRTRDAAHAMLRLEAAIAGEQWAGNAPGKPPADLAEAWRLVAFNQFHDAITGTLVDGGYDEIMDMLDRAEGIVRGHGGTTGRATVPPAATVADGGEREIRLGRLDCVVDLQGLRRVLVDGVDLFGERKPARLRPPLCIGELFLEEDFGDAWGQRLEPLGGRSSFYNGVPLGCHHDAVMVDDDAVTWHGVYGGGDPRVGRLRWRTTVRASDDGERLEFATQIDWDARSRRVRVIVPVADRAPVSRWEVPFGWVDRRYDVEAWDYDTWCGNQLEFPALHWTRHTWEAGGVALLSRGLPCVRWKPGLFDLSLLRAPEAAFCQVEQQHYEFWDHDGMRDAGRHSFHYALWPHVRPVDEVELTRVGYAYNGAAPALPFAVDGPVQVTAFKPAEDGDGWILRLHECGGGDGVVTVDFGRAVEIEQCDLLERGTGAVETGPTWKAHLTRFRILTLRIRPGGEPLPT